MGQCVPRTRVCWRQQTTATRWRQLPAADLSRDAGALDQLAEASDCERCTALGNKIERPIWPRALVPAARAIHPRAVGKLHRVIVCRELSDADQIIKSKKGGDRSTLPIVSSAVRDS
jgi:hypothetical protein